LPTEYKLYHTLPGCTAAAAVVLCAVYGAADLTQTNTVFLDSSFGMGYNLRELAQVCMECS